MKNVIDVMEERTDELPVRHVKSFDMDEITLVMDRTPVYSATSVEVRADIEVEIETRALYQKTEYSELETRKEDGEKIDYSEYEKRIKNLELEDEK